MYSGDSRPSGEIKDNNDCFRLVIQVSEWLSEDYGLVSKLLPSSLEFGAVQLSILDVCIGVVDVHVSGIETGQNHAVLVESHLVSTFWRNYRLPLTHRNEVETERSNNPNRRAGGYVR